MGFYIRELQLQQRNYSASEKGGVGLPWSVLHLHQYVEGTQTRVRTDHKCLSWIYRLTKATGRLLRWQLRLAEFEFEVKFRKGASPHLPDALFRVLKTTLDQKELDVDLPCFFLARAAKRMDANDFWVPVPSPPISAVETLSAQGADARC